MRSLQFFTLSRNSRLLRKPKFHYRIHKRPPPVPIRSQINPMHASSSLFLNIHFNIILLSLPTSYKWSLSPRYHHQNFVCISPIPHTCCTCATCHIFLGFITQIIFDDEYRSYSSSLCSLLHCPVTSFFLEPDVFLSTLFSNTPSLCSSLNVRQQIIDSYPFLNE